MSVSTGHVEWRIGRLRAAGLLLQGDRPEHGTQPNEWPAAKIAKLRVLWDEGHSTNEIGRRLGTSKNAVVGKAKRLGLPGRPSPIKRDGEPPKAPRPAQPPRVPKHAKTLPPLAPVQPPTAAQRDPVAPPPPIVAAKPVYVPPTTRECCWPITEPLPRRDGRGRTERIRFCEAASVPGKPYCPDHARRAYVRRADRREDHARA